MKAYNKVSSLATMALLKVSLLGKMVSQKLSDWVLPWEFDYVLIWEILTDESKGHEMAFAMAHAELSSDVLRVCLGSRLQVCMLEKLKVYGMDELNTCA